MVSKRRGYLDILGDILCFCSKDATKTQILYGCNLNSARLTLHLNALILMGLLEKDHRPLKIIYKTTLPGKQFLKKYAAKKTNVASSSKLSSKQTECSNKLSLVTSTLHLMRDLPLLSDLYNMEAGQTWRRE